MSFSQEKCMWSAVSTRCLGKRIFCAPLCTVVGVVFATLQKNIVSTIRPYVDRDKSLYGTTHNLTTYPSPAQLSSTVRRNQTSVMSVSWGKMSVSWGNRLGFDGTKCIVLSFSFRFPNSSFLYSKAQCLYFCTRNLSTANRKKQELKKSHFINQDFVLFLQIPLIKDRL